MAAPAEPHTTENALAQSYLLIGLCKMKNGSETFIPNSFCSYYFKDNVATKYLLHDEKTKQTKHRYERTIYSLRYAAYKAPADTMLT